MSNNKKRIFINFLTSYLFLLFTSMIISSVAYSFYIHTFKKEHSNNNRLMLQHIQHNFDDRYKELENFCNQIADNSYVKEFSSLEQNEVSEAGEIQTRIVRDFKNYLSVSNVEDFYVFFSNSDIIISPDEIYENKKKIPDHLNNSDEYVNWYRIIRTFHDKKTIKLSDHRNIEILSTNYIQSIPSTIQKTPHANIVLLLKESFFEKIIEKEDVLKYSSFFVLNGKDEIIFEKDSEINIRRIPFVNKMNGMASSLRIKLNDKDYILSSLDSENSDWKYVSIIDKSVFDEKINNIRAIFMVGTLCNLIIGLIISYFLTISRYKPLNRILTRLSGNANDLRQYQRNEYDFLNHKLDNLIEGSQKYLDETRKNIYKDSLRRVVKGESSSNEIHDHFKFLSDNFGIVLCHLEKLSGTMNDLTDLEESLRSIYNLDITKNDFIKIYTLQDDKRIICLINFQEEITKKNYLKQLFDISLRLYIVSKQSYSEDVFVTSSLMHKGISKIPMALLEAETTYTSRILFTENIISYSKIENLTNSYNYSLETETKFIGLLKLGNYSKARDYFESFFDENLYVNQISINAFERFLSGIESTMMKAFSEISNSSEYQNKMIPFPDIINFADTNEIKVYIGKIVFNICSIVNKKKKSHNYRMRDQIIEIIHEYYCDANLSLSFIAEKLEISSSYLSNFFKEQTGQNLLNYINTIRINRAKELLENKSLTLNEISINVGFGNSHTLIRIFKKHEGMTPGKYRDLNFGQDF